MPQEAIAIEKAVWADRGWWLAVEYGVLAKQDRFEKRLQKFRGLGTMKELLEPGGRIVYRNLFREDQVREEVTLLSELAPWKSQVHCYISGIEVPWKETHDVLWCAGYLRRDRPCLGTLPARRDEEKRPRAWTVGCDRLLSVAPISPDQAQQDEATKESELEKRSAFAFSSIDGRGTLRFDRDAIAAYLTTGTLARRCPVSPARDPVKLAAAFRDVNLRALGWPVVLEMAPALRKRIGQAALEAEHGFVMRKGLAPLGEHEAIELQAGGTKGGPSTIVIRRVGEARGGTMAVRSRVPARVRDVILSGARLRGVRIEEGYVKMPEKGGRYEVEQRFVISTRFHLGVQDEPESYEGYTVTTLPRVTPEYQRYASALLDEVAELSPIAPLPQRASERP